MNDLDKVCHLGRGPNGKVFVHIKLKNGNLFITGVEGPLSNGGCRGGAGQIIMHKWTFTSYAPGWTAEMVQRLREIWEQWYLNDMIAGSPKQEEELKKYKAQLGDRQWDYTSACTWLKEAGLWIDLSYPNPCQDRHPGEGYQYGTVWLRREIPESVIAELHQFPTTDVVPAWC